MQKNAYITLSDVHKHHLMQVQINFVATYYDNSL